MPKPFIDCAPSELLLRINLPDKLQSVRERRRLYRWSDCLPMPMCCRLLMLLCSVSCLTVQAFSHKTVQTSTSLRRSCVEQMSTQPEFVCTTQKRLGNTWSGCRDQCNNTHSTKKDCTHPDAVGLYVDTIFAGCRETRRSTNGGVAMVGTGCIKE